MVRGNAVRARGIGYDFMAGIKNITGGAVSEYSSLLQRHPRGGDSEQMIAEAHGNRRGCDRRHSLQHLVGRSGVLGDICLRNRGQTEVIVKGRLYRLFEDLSNDLGQRGFCVADNDELRSGA